MRAPTTGTRRSVRRYSPPAPTSPTATTPPLVVSPARRHPSCSRAAGDTTARRDYRPISYPGAPPLNSQLSAHLLVTTCPHLYHDVTPSSAPCAGTSLLVNSASASTCCRVGRSAKTSPFHARPARWAE
eukprot:1131955-Prymnesium_polylepis.1